MTWAVERSRFFIPPWVLHQPIRLGRPCTGGALLLIAAAGHRFDVLDVDGPAGAHAIQELAATHGLQSSGGWSATVGVAGTTCARALNHPIRVMPSRRRVLEAVDMDYWLIGDGGRTMSNGGRPNIQVIWGDDIGISNLSRYSDGLKAASFTVDQVMGTMLAGIASR